MRIARRERGRQGRVERRVVDVRRHQHRDAGGDRAAERRELDRASRDAPVAGDHRQLEVRVGRGVAVAGKVLAAGERARRRGWRETRRARPRGGVRGGAEGAIADDGVGGIAGDVEHRREGQVDLDRRELARHGRRDGRTAREAVRGDRRRRRENA